MSLFRTVVVIGAAIALLPTDKGKQQQLYAQVTALGRDAMTYCDRNAETCAKGAEAWETFKAKSAFAGELLLEAAARFAAEPEDRGPAGLARREAALAPAAHTSGTLTGRDLAPAWRGGKGQQRL